MYVKNADLTLDYCIKCIYAQEPLQVYSDIRTKSLIVVSKAGKETIWGMKGENDFSKNLPSFRRQIEIVKIFEKAGY